MAHDHGWSARTPRERRELVRRVDHGDEIGISVDGRLAARMVPDAPRRWLRWEDLADLLGRRQEPESKRDRELLDESVTNPWERGTPGAPERYRPQDGPRNCGA